MKSPSILFALGASLIAALVVAVHAMPPQAFSQSSDITVLAQADGGTSSRRDEIIRQGARDGAPPSYRRQLRGTIVDCHRDVRTHRINGEMVRHRHVGDNCEIRIVRQSSEPAPAD
jgi:hypothetical protein